MASIRCISVPSILWIFWSVIGSVLYLYTRRVSVCFKAIQKYIRYTSNTILTYMFISSPECHIRGGCGRDRIVVGFTTTYAVSAYHHQSDEFESRSLLGVLVSDLRQFLQVLRFPPPINLTAMI